MAEMLKRSGEGVTYDGRAEVTDVHLLGDVRGGVVDRDPFGLHVRNAKARVCGHLRDGVA